ncbi:MAG: proline dehydrogenase family protein [Flectobacillus sp.]|nr:proline dehydrogenase family protein [Flectobacillus sp.]
MPSQNQMIKPEPLSFDDTSVAFESKSNYQLRKTFLIYLCMDKNWLVKLGTFFIKLFIFLHFPIKKLIKSTVFEQFCGGENIEECNRTIKPLYDNHITAILDYSVGLVETEKNYEKITTEILKTIDNAAVNNAISFVVFKVSSIAPPELLEKVQSEIELTKDEKAAYERVRERMNMICKKAHENKVRAFVDAEESWIQDTIDTLVYGMMAKFNKEYTTVYNTFQMYRKDMLQNLKDAAQDASDEGYLLGVKLVRGAYMEKERQKAHEDNYCEPIFDQKEDTDWHYNAAITFITEHHDLIALCIGTHNEESCKHLVSLMQKQGISPTDSHFHFAQLLGMSDNVSYSLAKAGYNVSKYVPYGPIEDVLPYLFHHANENTSVEDQAHREYALIKRELLRRQSGK